MIAEIVYMISTIVLIAFWFAVTQNLQDEVESLEKRLSRMEQELESLDHLMWHYKSKNEDDFK